MGQSRITFTLLLLLVLSTGIVVEAAPASIQVDNSAVILMYHNVSEDTPASTSVTPERFRQHMQYLAENGFTVWPFFQMLSHLASGRPVPVKTIALTFDDAYRSVYDEAFPVLREKRWPFTVFVTTKYIGEGFVNYISWQQLREIRQFGSDVGNHSLSHPYFIRQGSDESQTHWRKRIIDEISQA